MSLVRVENKRRVQDGKILTDVASSPTALKFEFVKTSHSYCEQPEHLQAILDIRNKILTFLYVK